MRDYLQLLLPFFVRSLRSVLNIPVSYFFKTRKKAVRLWNILNVNVFIVSLFFIATIKIDETWFWLCSSTTYLWSNTMFLLGLACLVRKRNNIFINIIASLSFLYIGGSCGPLALISILILFGALLLSYFRLFALNINRRLLILRSCICLFFCVLSFSVLYFSEGNQVREGFFKDISIWHSLILNFKMTGIIIIKRLPSILPLVAILCLPIISMRSDYKEPSSGWIRKLFLISIIYLSFLFIYQLSITYKTQDVGAYRSLFFVTILTIFFFSYIYYIIGNNIRLNNRWRIMITAVVFIFSSCLFGYELLNQYNITRKYAFSYDNRMKSIREYNGDSKTLELDPLSSSGMIFSAELSKDTAHFSNQHFKEGLNLKFNVKLKTKENE